MIDNNQEYFKTKKFKHLLSQYEEAVQQGNGIFMDADDLADIADYYQFSDRPEEAERAINLAVEYNPDAVGPILYRAREAMTKKDYDTAREYAGHMMAVDQQEAFYLYGEIMIHEGKIEEADTFFMEKMKEIMPDGWADYVYDVASLFSDYNAHEKAIIWIGRSKGDESDEFKELMARTLFGLGKYKDSERIFNELVDHNPYSISYWNALASSQYMNEDFNAAITSSEYAIAINPNDPESLLQKANSLYSLGNYESALTFFERYTEVMPNDEFGFLHLGICMINLDRQSEALKALLHAEKLATDNHSPYRVEIYQEIAFTYGEMEEVEKAMDYLDKTLDLECDHASFEVIRGHILLQNKRLEDANIAFKRAMRLSDNMEKTMLRVIVSLFENHLVTPAYRLLKQLFKDADEDWNEGYSYMALCCVALKKEDEFMKYLKIAVNKNPKEAKIVLGRLFPEGMDPHDYYNFILDYKSPEA